MLNPDYALVAKGYGIASRLVTEREQLDDAIKEMLENPGAFLLHVAVKEEANVMPMTICLILMASLHLRGFWLSLLTDSLQLVLECNMVILGENKL